MATKAGRQELRAKRSRDHGEGENERADERRNMERTSVTNRRSPWAEHGGGEIVLAKFSRFLSRVIETINVHSLLKTNDNLSKSSVRKILVRRFLRNNVCCK